MLARLSAIAITLLLVSFAGAQQNFFHRPSPFAGSFMTSLASFAEVQKELKLTADDSKKIDDVLDKTQEEIQGAFGDAGGDFAKLNVAIAKIEAKADGDYLKTLTADQSKRLKELFVQFAGTAIMVREDFAKDLGLTDDQKAKVSKLQADQGKKVGDLFSAGGDPASMAPELKKLQDQFKLDLATVLTEDQKKKLDEMKGAKFEFAKSASGG